MNSLFVILSLNEFELIYQHIVSIVSTQLNGLNYWFETEIFLFNINNLFAQNEGSLFDSYSTKV